MYFTACLLNATGHCIHFWKWPFLKNEKKLLLRGSAILAGRGLKKMKIHFEDHQALSLPKQDAQAGWVASVFGGCQTDKALIMLVWNQFWSCFEWDVGLSISMILHWGIISGNGLGTDFSTGNSISRSEIHFCNGKFYRGSNPKPQHSSPFPEESRTWSIITPIWNLAGDLFF